MSKEEREQRDLDQMKIPKRKSLNVDNTHEEEIDNDYRLVKGGS